VDPCPADELSWSFDLGGGELLRAEASGIEVLFGLPGTCHLRAEVTDDDGGSAFEEMDVLVVPSGDGNRGCGCGSSPGGSLWLLFLLLWPVIWRTAATS
jgi:hypothetical protein